MNHIEKQNAIAAKFGEVLKDRMSAADLVDVVTVMTKLTAFLISKIHEGHLPEQLKMADGVAKIVKQMLKNDPDLAPLQ